MAVPVVAEIAAYAAGKIKQAAALGTLVVILSWIMDWLGLFPDWLWHFLKRGLDAIWLLLRDMFLWVFDTVLGFVVSLLNEVDIDFSFANPANYIGGVGSDILNIINLIRLPEALTIIVSAIVIRVVLQLIPFTRLGS